MSFERCEQCNHWINTSFSDHLVFNMHDGTEVFTHYQKNFGCGEFFQEDNCVNIKCAELVRAERKGERQQPQPRDYAL